MNVYVRGKKVRLDPARALGKGGEADVYDMGSGLALKVFKQPEHPDLAASPADQRAARVRLDEHQTKLGAFPAGLPDRVVAPEALATARSRGGRIVGYAMQRIDQAELLYRFSEPRLRRQLGDPNLVVAALRDLRGTVEALHAAQVVIGDFNDLNVLVAGQRAYLIDADSFQYGGYQCSVFTERFVDPVLCDQSASAPVLASAHTAASDWYAFSVIAFRTLLCVGPYGGVHRPADRSRQVPHARRPLERLTVLDPEVVYPKPAIPFRVLPDEVLGYFADVYTRDCRIPFPAALLDELRWTRCSGCGGEHARLVCPACAVGQAASKRARIQVRGSVTAERVVADVGEIVAARLGSRGLEWLAWNGRELLDHAGQRFGAHAPRPGRRFHLERGGIAIAEHGRVRVIEPGGAETILLADVCGGATALATNTVHRYWITGGQLRRDGHLGDAVIGEALAGQTRLWVGESMGLGFYRAGNLCVAFVFDAHRTGLDDGVALPPLRGATIDVHAVIGGERAWLFVAEQVGARAMVRCFLIDQRGHVLAAAEDRLDEAAWMNSARGASALGELLFVPTDDGIARVEPDSGTLRITRTFPDTEPFVDRGQRLLAGPSGLFVVGRDRITRLDLSPRRTP
ncbi:MAG TPA: hypothetical protein VML75_23625 [Kofleriaceae bacterium]|nr:hypothetical protein [Kofleriaceae bacterium]